MQYEHAWLNKLERSALSINVLTLLFGTGLHTNEQAGESRNAALAELLSGGVVFLNVETQSPPKAARPARRRLCF